MAVREPLFLSKWQVRESSRRMFTGVSRAMTPQTITYHVGKQHCNGMSNSPEQLQPGGHGFDHCFSTQNNAGASHENPVNL